LGQSHCNEAIARGVDASFKAHFLHDGDKNSEHARMEPFPEHRERPKNDLFVAGRNLPDVSHWNLILFVSPGKLFGQRVSPNLSGKESQYGGD